MIRNLRLIGGTGEIVQETKERFSDSLNEDGYRIPSHKLGSRIFSDVQFPKGMTDADIGKMTRLSKLMIGKTNMLGYRKNRRILAYTPQEIGKLVGIIHDRPARDFVNKMLNLRVMQKIMTNSGVQYYINPAYFMANGQRLSLELFLLFRNELTPIVPQWVITEFLLQAQGKKEIAK